MIYSVAETFKCFKVHYEIHFVSCSHELSEKQRKQIVRQHKSSETKSVIRQKVRNSYTATERRTKQNLL